MRQTKSHPRNLLSIATLKSARSRKLFANSRRAWMAQTCFGSKGHFGPMRRPLFLARFFGVVAGSWTLGISCPPYLPPNPNVGTAPTMDYSIICDDCFGPIMQMYHAACASDCKEPNVLIHIFCRVHSQRWKCRVSEKISAAPQRENRPFTQTAARIGSRIHSSRTMLPFMRNSAMSAFRGARGHVSFASNVSRPLRVASIPFFIPISTICCNSAGVS